MSTSARKHSWLHWDRELFVWDGPFKLRRLPLNQAERELAAEDARRAPMTRLALSTGDDPAHTHKPD